MRTEAELARERAEMESNPQVGVSAWRCWCGEVASFSKLVWMASGDQLKVTCSKGHVCLLRFAPETVT